MRQLFEFYALFVKFVQKLSFIFAFAFPASLFVLFTRVHAFSYGYMLQHSYLIAYNP